MSLATESICVDPRKLVDMEMAANILAAILNLDAKELLARMQSAGGNKRGFLWVKRKITREEAKRLRDLKLEWIEFRMESQRYYPNKSLAAHVIGSVDFEGKGKGVVERSMHDALERNDGPLPATSDGHKRRFRSQA